MNNPLEAVTQAVNSLVTALKLPDESAKANEVLGEMSFPQFSRLLPYRDYNQESGLFMNDTTMGFMLEAIPINGANESIVEALDHMLRTKLPRGIPLCIHLMSSQLVGDRIEYGLREFSWSGEQAERFNAITRAYYMKAAATQFPLPEGMNLPLTLRHYGQYFNSDEPSLRDDAKMVVLELGGLEDRPSLLVAVMFSLIIYIENRMYRTPRNLKKLNVIDEGWRLLDFKNHKVGEFIEKGYRTARRHTGAYITITQNIVDFDSDKASSAARAAWGNSSYKIILKQSAKEFAKYNQLYPDQFLPLQRDMIGKFGAAKDQWFSSFLLQVENHSSWHRLFVDPLSRAMYSSDGPDFEFVQQKRKEGLSIHEAVWQLAWKKSGPEMASLEAWLEEHEKYRSVA
ncbi:TraC family protein [Escherichia coli]|nr:TraC family protein [Escherichia coli]